MAQVSWLPSIALSRNHLATSQLSEAIGGSVPQLEKNPETENKICFLPALFVLHSKAGDSVFSGHFLLYF